MVDRNAVSPSNAPENAEAVFRAIVWNDASRDSICWLEFWVYMCSHGVKPNEE